MKFFNIIKETLKEEKLPEGKSGILLLDIDDTLLKADSSNIKIYRKLPTDKEEIPLTTAEYAREHITKETKPYYDYRDFRDYDKVYDSIKNGVPLLNNLKVLDSFYNGGYDIGILTARGATRAVRNAIRDFLKVKDSKGNLIPLRIMPANVHCVNDDDYPYPGDTDFEKKQNVLRKYAKQYDYDYVYFIDDDPKNLNALKSLKKTDPDIANRLRSINAKKNIKEEVLSESPRRRPVEEDIFEAINDEDFEKAIILHFNKIKSLPIYSGLKDAKSALRHMISYGLKKNFYPYEKSGKIFEGLVSKMKEYGLEHLDEIAEKVEFEGNSNYVKPAWTKSTLRKKFMAKELKDLEEMIEKAKVNGYVFKEEPKKGNTAKDGNFYYTYGTIKKPVNEESVFIIQKLLTEMAKKDITPQILKDINSGNYKDAIVNYLNTIKTDPKYEKFNGNVFAFFNNFMTYGFNRTFAAEERAGRIPNGSVNAMKKFVEVGDNKKEILNGIGADFSKPITSYVKPSKEEKKENLDAVNLKGIAKIKNRLNEYKDIIRKLDTYRGTMNLSKLVPEFMAEKFWKDLNFFEKKDAIKAEAMGPERYERFKNDTIAKKMSTFLTTLVNTFEDFIRENEGRDVSEKDLLDELKNDARFDMKDFAALERFYKNNRINKDKEKNIEPQRTKDSLSPEVGETRKEYITFLTNLEKALNNDDIINFFNSNIELINAALEPSQNPEDEQFSNRAIEYWKKNRADIDELSPELKKLYDDRAEESKDIDFGKKYDSLRTVISAARTAYNKARKEGDESKMAKAQAELEKCAKSVIKVFLDRLIAIDILSLCFNNKKTALNPTGGNEKYEKVKEKKEGEMFAPWNKKYNKYFVEPTVGEMYEAISKTLNRLTDEQTVEKQLQVPKAINVRFKRYTKEEVEELYNALNEGGAEKLFELLATPKFKALRSKKK